MGLTFIYTPSVPLKIKHLLFGTRFYLVNDERINKRYGNVEMMLFPF